MSQSTLKTFKNYLNGAFTRSESNLTAPITLNGNLYNIVTSTRKDYKAALVANRKTFESFSKTPELLKSQLIYRTAENFESRKEEIVKLLKELNVTNPQKEFKDTLDLLITLAGWPDKYKAILSSVNPVAGNFFNTSIVEPIGVSTTFLTLKTIDPLQSLVYKIFIPFITGNTNTIIVELELAPLSQTIGEILAHSDIPAGAVNILSANIIELIPTISSHYDLDAIETSTLANDLSITIREHSAKSNLKKIIELKSDQNILGQLSAFTETKTIWQTIGY